MLTVKEPAARAVESSVNGCHQCHGTGSIQLWSEFSNFEDRRRCTQCEAGRRLGSIIADIVARVAVKDRNLSR